MKKIVRFFLFCKLMNLDSTYYQLNKRIRLEQISQNQIAIVKLIKSRIIRKDAEKIVSTARQIQSIEPNTKVSLVCHKNICSKSLKLLEENDIEVIYQD